MRVWGVETLCYSLGVDKTVQLDASSITGGGQQRGCLL